MSEFELIERAQTHDQTVLKDAKPEEIVGLYYYCSQLEDE